MAPFESKTGLESVLTTLGFALPPSALIHVGIGDGVGASCIWMDWGIQNVLVVEADASRLQKAKDVLVARGYGANFKGAMAARVALVGAAVVGAGASAKDVAKTDDVSFYRASHPRESGLINPEALRGFWPSLSLGSTSAMKAVSVDEFWQSFLLDKEAQVESDQIDDDGKQDGLNWLVVDCLAGVAILDGASEVLRNTAVVCVRALRDVAKVSSKQPLTLLLESGVEHLDVYLGSLGFRRVAFVADSHPDVGYGVYCRDGEALAEKKSQPLKEMIDLQEKDLAQVKSEREGLNKQLQEVTVSLDQAKQSKEQAVTEINGQLKTVTSDKHALVQQKSVLEADTAALKQQLSELTKKLGDAEQRVETVLQERASLAKQSEDLTQQMAALKVQLEKAQHVESGLTQQKDETVKRLGDIEAKLAAVAKEKEVLVAHVDVLGQEKAALVTERDALIGKRDALSLEKDVLTNDKQALIAEKTSLVTLRDKLAGDKAAIAAQLEEQKKVVAERQVKIDELTQSVQGEAQKVKDLTVKFEGVNAEKAGLAQQRDDAVKKLVDVEAKVGVLSQEIGSHISYRDEISAQIQGFAEQVNLLNQAVEAAQTEKESLRQSLQQEHEAAKKALEGEHQVSVTGLEQRIDSLNNELEAARVSTSKLKNQNNELQHRQALMNEELVRADGQIHLIKDLLLSDKGV